MALATNSTPGSIVLAGDLTGVAAAPELRVTGVAPGVYYSPSVVIDAKGRIIYAKSQWVLQGDAIGIGMFNTNVLSPTGIAAATYKYPTITVNSSGRITGIVSNPFNLAGDITGGGTGSTIATTLITRGGGTFTNPTITVNESGLITQLTQGSYGSYSEHGWVRVDINSKLGVVNGALSLIGGAVKTSFPQYIGCNDIGELNIGPLVPLLTSNAGPFVYYSTPILQLTNNLLIQPQVIPTSNADLYLTPTPSSTPLTFELTLPTDPQLQSFDVVITPMSGVYVADSTMRSAQYNGSRYVSLCRAVYDAVTPNTGVRVTTSTDGKWWKNTVPSASIMLDSGVGVSVSPTTDSRLLLGPGGVFYVFDFYRGITFTSLDGLSWSHVYKTGAWQNMRVDAPNWTPSEVHWNGSVFSVVGRVPSSSAPNCVLLTSTDGSDWTRFTPQSDLLSNLLLMNSSGTFCVVSAGANNTMTSSDGYSWVYTPIGEISNAYSVVGCTHGTTFIIIANNPVPDYIPGLCLISGDGRNWSRVGSLPFDGSWISVASNGNLVCATTTGDRYEIAVSSNGGINWETRVLPFKLSWPVVTSANGIFFVTGSQGAGASGENPDSRPVMCLSSPDCINWTILTNPSPIQTDITTAPGFRFNNSQDGMRQVLTCTKGGDEFFCTYQ